MGENRKKSNSSLGRFHFMGGHPQWFSTAGGQCYQYLCKPGNWYQKAGIYKKRNIILGILALMLGIGLLVFDFLDKEALAKETAVKQVKSVKVEELDPWSRVGKGRRPGAEAAAPKVCRADKKTKLAGEKDGGADESSQKFQEMVAGYPIEVMVPHIVGRDRKVAAYLIAIAKKESSWGKHTPKKDGQECWNLWGYRGSENPTASGYSCFDSPEHAVRVVGDRIEKLIEQKIDTPTRMVVWKCGRDCEAAGGQAAADKWISDVAHIYGKLSS
jgi:hypothetical protein